MHAHRLALASPVSYHPPPLFVDPGGIAVPATFAMLLDYQFAACTRECAATGKRVEPGETYFSTLTLEGAEMRRRDYCAAAWQGPPEEVVAWWQSRAPSANAAQAQLAPRDVLLNLFSSLEEQPHEIEFRYVLGLLLLRKRILRLRETLDGVDDRETLLLDCPTSNEQYELVVATPAASRVEQIEQRIVKLLYSDVAEE